MKELVINGVSFGVEEGQGDEVTFLGQEAVTFITDIVEAQQPVTVSEPRGRLEKAFTQVFTYGQTNGVPFIRVSFVPLRFLNEPRFTNTSKGELSYVGKKTKTVELNHGDRVIWAGAHSEYNNVAERLASLQEENDQLTARNAELTDQCDEDSDNIEEAFDEYKGGIYLFCKRLETSAFGLIR